GLATRYFYITESLIVKLSCELILFFTAEDEDVRLEWVGFLISTVIYVDIGHVQTSIIIKTFAMLDFKNGSFRAFDFELCYTCHVLTHIKDIGCVVKLLYRLWGI